ncbi:MAG TPA: acyltransferase [Pseudolabrys sp.]|nr:acyltransferase [Pseudolabrys sp.]
MSDDTGAPKGSAMDEFARQFRAFTHFKDNPFHPFVWIVGEPEIGEGVYIGGFSEVNANGARVRIGAHCDIASFVSINCADSHKRCIGLSEQTERADITIEDHVFIGSHSFIRGGVHIGHHSVIGAGTILTAGIIPPYSLAVGNPPTIKPGYYLDQLPKGARD